MKLPLRSWIITLTLLSVGFPVAVARGEAIASTNWPSTRAGRMAAAFVEAFHAEDESLMRRFTQENRDAASLQRVSLDERMAQFTQMRQQLGKLEVASVTAEGEFKAEVIAKSSKMGIWLSLSFALQEAEPFKLAHFSMRPAAPPASEAAQERFIEWADLQELVVEARQETAAPAIVMAVMQDGKIVESAGVGVRQVGGADTVQLTDCFQVGSISKAMTATMIAKLIDMAILRWDMSIAEVLPETAMRPEYRQVTLEQLLQHRGGLPAYVDDDIDVFPELAQPGRTTTEERVLFAAQVLNDEPVGTAGAFLYSNAGYAVASLMAERAADKPFEQLMQDLLFHPLQMRSARFGWPASEQHVGQPRGHFGETDHLRVQELDEEPWQAYMLAAGGASCNIEDLGRFALWHLQGMTASARSPHESVVRLHQPMAAADAPTNYAAGWVIEKTASGEPKHWHGGSAGSFYATLSLYPERDLAIAIAINCAGTAVAIVEELEQAIYSRWTKNSGAAR